MKFEKLVRNLREKLPSLGLAFDEPMSRHTSFRIGGPVAVMALPSSAEELRLICREARNAGVRPFVFGNGTNLLVQDAPLNVFAVKTSPGLSEVRLAPDGNIFAMSGVLLSALAVFAQKNSLSGLEFAHGIPGTLGGAVSMNAGAYGGEMCQVVERTEYLDEDLEIRAVTGDEHGFSYRRSVFSDSGKIVLSSLIRLQPGDAGAIKGRMEELSARRRSSQPLNMPSAGSVFKRPVGGYAAALIDSSGLKGLRVGAAEVSEKHAGFIVNLGGATCDDVLRLIDQIRERVLKEHGVNLQTEIKHITG
ncbi:MAG: UDP-N-acetylmuramate dehydrogenase [Clostridiales bacterium]|nr:UDP-N-acetylmuramate dehydrogenase [Clostridiales bacterium]